MNGHDEIFYLLGCVCCCGFYFLVCPKSVKDFHFQSPFTCAGRLNDWLSLKSAVNQKSIVPSPTARSEVRGPKARAGERTNLDVRRVLLHAW